MQGPALSLAVVGEGRDQISSSSDPFFGQLSLSQVARNGGGRLSLTHVTTWVTKDLGSALPLSYPLGRLLCTPTERVSSALLPW